MRSVRRLRYAVEAGLLYTLYGFFRVWPVALASGIGGALFAAIGPQLAVSRRARRRIVECLPQADADAVLRGMWENLGRTFAEFPHLHRIESRIKIIGREIIDAAKTNGPVIFATGHFANWEVIAHAGITFGLDLAIIYREPNNIFVRRLLRHARRAWQKSGAAKGFPKGREGGFNLFQHVRRGGSAALLMDQRLNDGVAVPFFGRPAMTTPAVAELALRCGGTIIPATCVRLPGARFQVIAEAPIPLPPADGPREEQVQKILRDIHARMERWISERPAEWLWLHDRWEQRR